MARQEQRMKMVAKIIAQYAPSLLSRIRGERGLPGAISWSVLAPIALSLRRPICLLNKSPLSHHCRLDYDRRLPCCYLPHPARLFYAQGNQRLVWIIAYCSLVVACLISSTSSYCSFVNQCNECQCHHRTRVTHNSLSTFLYANLTSIRCPTFIITSLFATSVE